MRNNEREKESEGKCFLCDSIFSNKGNMNKHLQKAHGVDNRSSVRLLKCPLCEQDCTTCSNLCEHISIVHNVAMKKECKDFDSLQEFKIWKRNVEKEDLSFFVVQRVVGNKTYYACHRSGSSRKEAGMILTNNEGQVTVEFRRTHVGHALNMKFLHLSKEERDELAGRIKSGVTFERILDDIRKSASTAESVNRFHAVDKRDLHNIVRDYDLDRDIVHTNDAFSTEIWVQEQILLMRFARDMMFERTIRMMKNKPTYRMEQIAHSHHQSVHIEDSKITNINTHTWLVQSATSDKSPYSVTINNTENCIGCPLACPNCHVCVHQFTCTCIDYKIKGNFCKHVHACIRVSNKKFEISIDEDRETSAFDEHNRNVVEGVQINSVHPNESVSISTRFTALLNAAVGVANTATD
ncbi:hypothetical protein ACI65C_003941 [Semiaphis heraclei]